MVLRGKQNLMYFLLQQTGDEMSKRSKFLLVTWVGLGVSPIKKAKMSTDKALVKEILAVSSISCADYLHNELFFFFFFFNLSASY